ncbi:hypothetical protein ACLQ3K_21975 [Tsukamurella sp. DT100]|uniref:hypothetical protein n=1 Tax=Tsukamurella sp. DT100 TaxID=3393415 RepID=UPI003CED059B
MSIENPAPAHPPQDAPESRSTAERGGGNTRRSVAVSPTDDRITVQRVTSTVAGECREWTITVRQSSPADRPASELTRAGAVAVLPTPVRDWLSAWLEGRMVHAGEHIVPRDLLAAALGQPDPCGTRVISGGGVRSACLLPVGHDGDHQPSAHTAAPLFPIAEPEPAAPFAGRTAPRRTLPPEAPVRLWNREHTDKLDVIGRAVRGEAGTRVQVRAAQVDTAYAWLTPHFEPDDGGATVFVAWMDREWSLAGYSYDHDRRELVLMLGAIPKPPRVDEVLGRAPYAGPFPHLAKGDRIGVEHPDGTITTHEFSGDPANPNTRRDALAQATRDSADEVCAARSGEGLTCEGKPDHRGAHYATDHETSGGRIVVWGAGQRAIDAIDEVLPMPGGPNDKLSQADRVAYRTARTAAGGPSISFYLPDGARASADTTSTMRDGRGVHVQIADPYVKAWLREHIDHGSLRADWNGTTWNVTGVAWPFDDVTAVALMPPGPYADLYARLPYLHDAVAEEDQ